jgi:hypothetical protein
VVEAQRYKTEARGIDLVIDDEDGMDPSEVVKK